MDAIILNGTEDTPAITLDKQNNKISFQGVSLPEDVKEFYYPILAWIDEYFANPNPETIFEFKMTYFNTASSKMILDIMYKVKDAITKGHKVSVTWGYFIDDEEMMEAGEDFGDIVEIPVTLKVFS